MAIVLITIACAPIFAALFSLVFLSEWISRASWSAIFCCFIGIIIAVSDGDNVIAAPDGSALIGAICGLTAAASLGLSFVLLRSNDAIPLLGMNGLGSFLAGCVGLVVAVTTPDGPSLFAGNMLMISVSGLIILPISFVALTSATRHTNAANVSLFMFLETILGSFWVWLGVGERPGFLDDGRRRNCAKLAQCLYLIKHAHPARYCLKAYRVLFRLPGGVFLHNLCKSVTDKKL